MSSFSVRLQFWRCLPTSVKRALRSSLLVDGFELGVMMPRTQEDAGLYSSFPVVRMLVCLWYWEVSAFLQKQLFSVLTYQCYGLMWFFSKQRLLVFNRFNDTFEICLNDISLTLMMMIIATLVLKIKMTRVGLWGRR